MKYTVVLLIVLAAVALSSSSVVAQQQQISTPPAAATQQALLNQYCVTCHNQRAKTAGVMFDTMDVSDISKNADIWEKAVRKLRGGMMPPPGARQPERAGCGRRGESKSWACGAAPAQSRGIRQCD